MEDEPPSVALPPPTVRACYAHAWEMFKRFWAPLLLVTGLVVLVIAGGMIVQLAWERNPESAPIGSAIGFAYSLLIANPFQVGAFYAFLKAARGERPHVDDLFVPFRQNYLAAVFAPFLTSVLSLFGLLLLIVPGIYVAVRLAFVPFLVVDEGLGPTAALAESWRRTEGRFWALLGGALLGLFAVWVGLILALIGIIPAALWVGVAYATMYAATTAGLPRER